MLGGAGHSSLEGGEVGGDAIDMEVNKGLLAFGAEDEGAVGGVVHEDVFGEGGGAVGMAEEVEVFLEVGGGVGVVGAEALGQGYVRFLRHQERGVKAPDLESGDDVAGLLCVKLCLSCVTCCFQRVMWCWGNPAHNRWQISN